MVFPEEFKTKVKNLFPNCEEMNQRLESGDAIYIQAQIGHSLDEATNSKYPELLSDPVFQHLSRDIEGADKYWATHFELIRSTASYDELRELFYEFMQLKNADWEATLAT